MTSKKVEKPIDNLSPLDRVWERLIYLIGGKTY
jgi:hypothetical protein